MTDDAALSEIKRSLIENAGGYLRNTVHIPGETCSKCRGTQMRDGYSTCYHCEWEHGAGTADLVGSIVYGVSDAQSGKMMHQYKLAPHLHSLVQRVSSLVTVGVKGHFDCADLLLGGTPTRWATVPSLRNIGSEHPLRQLILTPMLGAKFEIAVSASELAKGKSERERRVFNPDFYQVDTDIPAATHALLIDDTWATGGHIQSVAAALKQAGVARVAALSVARWLDVSEGRTKRVYSELIKPIPYNPAICPWTGRQCPTEQDPFAPSRKASGRTRRRC